MRLPTDPELNDLATRAVGRVVTYEERLFMGPWTQLASPVFERGFVQYHWLQRAQWKPDSWVLELAAFDKDSHKSIGIGGLSAERFAVTRSVTTGSWILPEYRGRGLGKELRRALLALAFDGLGAVEARSSAYVHNAASNAISRSLGYQPDGVKRDAVNGDRHWWKLDVEVYQPHSAVRIHGLDQCLELFLGTPET
jgi:RimJ/RimL family protein N-acetyltransferase